MHQMDGFKRKRVGSCDGPPGLCDKPFSTRGPEVSHHLQRTRESLMGAVPKRSERYHEEAGVASISRMQLMAVPYLPITHLPSAQ